VILTLRNISISQNIVRKTLIFATVTRLNIIGCTFTPGILFEFCAHQQTMFKKW
jgi:predicted cupin superfamily sugar epimerase